MAGAGALIPRHRRAQVEGARRRDAQRDARRDDARRHDARRRRAAMVPLGRLKRLDHPALGAAADAKPDDATSDNALAERDRERAR